MKREGKAREYILGLDIGAQSVGWAIVDLDRRGNPCRIRKTGVRAFHSGVGSPRQIEFGWDEPANVQRREARRRRRLCRRRAQRQRGVLRILQDAGLLPPGPLRAQERHRRILALDARLAVDFAVEGDRAKMQVLPYRLRAMALDAALPPHALGRALYHLAQRRGFLPNRKTPSADAEAGTVKKGIAELERAMARTNARTLGEYFAAVDPEEERIRGRWTSRRMYQEEFEKIWAAQRAHHPALTADLQARLARALFFQRPLKSHKELVARCELEPSRRRAPLASLAAQRFRYWRKLSELEVIEPDGALRPLRADERDKLAAALDVRAALTFASARKLLGFRRPDGGEHDYWFNLEDSGEKRLPGNRTSARIGRILGRRWKEMPDENRTRLVDEILAFEETGALVRRLVEAWGLDAAAAAKLAAVGLDPGRCEVSRRAIAKLLPKLRQGMSLPAARQVVYPDRLSEGKPHELLPPALTALPFRRSPAVCRALTEARKVVNAVVRKFGKPTCIRVELARGLKKGRQARRDDVDRARRNEKRRREAAAKIAAELAVASPRPSDVLKVLLAEECRWECPFTGKPITLETLLGSSPQFDVEHIIPLDRGLDDSFANKTLCCRKEKRRAKFGRTPWEAYGASAARFSEVLARARRFQSEAAAGKRRRFLRQETPEGPLGTLLEDTRRTSRIAADYFGLLFGGRCDAAGRVRVQVSSEIVPRRLREAWGLNVLLPADDPKSREDYRNAAVRAVSVALTSPCVVERLCAEAALARDGRRRRAAPFAPPWKTREAFLDEVRSTVEAIRVSFRVDRRVRGALHGQTFYSPVRRASDAKGRILPYRHVRKRLANMSAKEIEAIVDDKVRAIVQAKLQEMGGDPKKAFADPDQLPYLVARDGRRIPIRKARVRKHLTTIAIGRAERERHVGPGPSHHLEIVATVDENGKDRTWEGIAVSLYEAAGRLRRGEPLVERHPSQGRQFRFSLAVGEYVEMEHEPGEPKLYRVMVLSKTQLEFRLHTDGRSTQGVREIAGERVKRAPGALLKAKARKVLVDPLGNLLPAND